MSINQQWEKEFSIEGWAVTCTTYREGDLYVCETQSTFGQLACMVDRSREIAEQESLDTAARRLRWTRRGSLESHSASV
jgi:hypothetical protein